MNDYDRFYLGEVRVTQARDKEFLAYGEHLNPGVWIWRGQVHIDSPVDSEAVYGERGKLYVNRWWALSRGLKEARSR
jgi:hypothetical protein